MQWAVPWRINIESGQLEYVIANEVNKRNTKGFLRTISAAGRVLTVDQARYQLNDSIARTIVKG